MATKPSREAFQRESESLKARNAERRRMRTAEDNRARQMAKNIIDRVRAAHVTEHDKAVISALGKDKSVNFVARKMELDLVVVAAIIDGIIV